MTSQRNPYRRPITSRWWTKIGYYQFYMIRELTSIFMLWFSLLLLYGMYTLSSLQEETVFLQFLQHPAVLFMNIISFIAAILHSVTWFNLTPKAAQIIIKNRKMPAYIPILSGWIIMLLVSLILSGLMISTT